MAKEAEVLVREFCRIIAKIVARLLRKNEAGQDYRILKEKEGKK